MKRFVFVALFSFSALACDGPTEPPPKPEVVSVGISPADTTVDIVHQAILFAVRVEVKNGASKEVKCGTVDGKLSSTDSRVFLYDPPDEPGTYKLSCESVFDRFKFATATVNVVRKDLIAFWRMGDDSTRTRCSGARCEEIYLMNADGSGVRRLTITPWFQDFEPTWFPDGKRIAFARSGGLPPIPGACSNGAQSIFVIDILGRNLKNITNCQVTGQEPSVSPDGQWIAFFYLEPPGAAKSGGIAVIDTNGANLRLLTREFCTGFCNPDRTPNWSHNGRWIVFGRKGDIYRMTPDGGDTVNLTNTPDIYEAEPVYSPDDSQISFAARPRTGGNWQIWVMSADGTLRRQLTSCSVSCGDATWSPDGRRIAYAWRVGDIGEIYLMNAADGSNPVNNTNSPETPERWPVWRP